MMKKGNDYKCSNNEMVVHKYFCLVKIKVSY